MDENNLTKQNKEIDKLIAELFEWLQDNDPNQFPNFIKITLATKLGLLSAGIDDWTSGRPLEPEAKEYIEHPFEITEGTILDRINN